MARRTALADGAALVAFTVIGRLLATWLLGISAAVVIRAVIVGHFAADFYGIALAFTLLFVLAARKARASL